MNLHVCSPVQMLPCIFVKFHMCSMYRWRACAINIAVWFRACNHAPPPESRLFIVYAGSIMLPTAAEYTAELRAEELSQKERLRSLRLDRTAAGRRIVCMAEEGLRATQANLKIMITPEG